jgi:hypothetical protein
VAVYFAQAPTGGPIKIGYSEDPADRVRSLRYRNGPVRLLATIPYGGRSLEKSLHGHFHSTRVSSLGMEWFRATRELKELVVCFGGSPAGATSRMQLADPWRVQPGVVTDSDPEYGARVSYTEPPHLETVADRLQRLVDFSGLTPSALAHATGVSRGDLWLCMNGIGWASDVQLEALAVAFGVSVAWLRRGSLPHRPDTYWPNFTDPGPPEPAPDPAHVIAWVRGNRAKSRLIERYWGPAASVEA